MKLSLRLRLLRMGLSTVFATAGLGGTPRGFFIPYRYAGSVPRPLPSYAPIEGLFDAAQGIFQRVLELMDEHAAALEALGPGPPPAPRWAQGWFPRLDAAAAYALVRARQPARIVEVGCGHSTRFLARAISDGGLDTRITAIDPRPRTDIAALPVHYIAATVQRAGLDAFAEMTAGDVLFIDSSHIAMPGSDVDFLFGRILPALPAGILLHLHDVRLPDDYPAAWQWRAYNEQQAVIALLAGGGFTPLFASHYVATRMADAVAESVAGRLPLLPDTPETSLWLEKTAQPIGPM